MHHGNAVRTNRLSVYNQCLDLLIVFCFTFLYLVIDTCREDKGHTWKWLKRCLFLLFSENLTVVGLFEIFWHIYGSTIESSKQCIVFSYVYIEVNSFVGFNYENNWPEYFLYIYLKQILFHCQSSITIGSRSSNLFFGFGDSDLKAFASWSLLLVSWSPPITTLNCFSLSSVPKYGMTKL